MRSDFVDITGQRFNSFLVIGYSHKDRHSIFWRVVCDCGREVITRGRALKSGSKKNCGCVNESKRKRLIDCSFCGKRFYKWPCIITEKNYCGRSCHHKSMLKEKEILTCEVCKKDFLEYKSYLNHRKRFYCSRHCRRIGDSLKKRGENSNNWKGGVSYINGRIRKGVEWKMWREAIFKRDDWTCQDCGARSGKGKSIELHPHHVKQYATHPELRFDVSNGITLCKECHKKTDTYLRPIPRPPYQFTKAVLREHRKIRVDSLKSTDHPNAIRHLTREIEMIDNDPIAYGKSVQYEIDCFIDGYCRQFGITRDQYLEELDLS